MRTFALVILVLLVTFLSCNGPDSGPTGGEQLPTTAYTIDPTKDTVIKTPGGAKLKITAGTFDAGESHSVQLEVKEAYTTDDLNKGKLSTQLGEDALSSDGVIYVNLTAGQSVSIIRPLSVSMPVKSLQKDMQMYKGQVNGEGTVIWADPQPLGENPVAKQIDAGKTIYLQSCAGCHKLKGNLHAPGLAFLLSRRDRQWLYDYTRNNAKMLWRGDPYTCFLFNRYGQSPMPTFPELSDGDLNGIFEYVTSASKAVGVGSDGVADLKLSFDSCAKNDPKCSGSVERMLAMHGGDTTVHAAAIVVENYYTFLIDKHGWYNVAVKGGGKPMEVDSTAAGTGEMLDVLQSCPCWCNESSYRKADSVARANSKP